MVLQKTLGLAKCLSNFTCGPVPFSVFIYLFIYLWFFSSLDIEFFNKQPTNLRENVNPNLF